jgi:hypothetical protein
MEDGRLVRLVRTEMVIVREDDNNKPRQRRQLKFKWLGEIFAVCRLPPDTPLPEWTWTGPFTSVTRTADELSIVCLADSLPPNLECKDRWICFKLEGPFSFSEVGILASFIDPLAQNGVPVFAVSTYDTDYVLVSEDYAGAALGALRQAGHELLP